MNQRKHTAAEGAPQPPGTDIQPPLRLSGADGTPLFVFEELGGRPNFTAKHADGTPWFSVGPCYPDKMLNTPLDQRPHLKLFNSDGREVVEFGVHEEHESGVISTAGKNGNLIFLLAEGDETTHLTLYPYLNGSSDHTYFEAGLRTGPDGGCVIFDRKGAERIIQGFGATAPENPTQGNADGVTVLNAPVEIRDPKTGAVGLRFEMDENGNRLGINDSRGEELVQLTAYPPGPILDPNSGVGYLTLKNGHGCPAVEMSASAKGGAVLISAGDPMRPASEEYGVILEAKSGKGGFVDIKRPGNRKAIRISGRRGYQDRRVKAAPGVPGGVL